MMAVKERILIIEDERPMRTVLKDALERQGYRPLTAADGEAGLEVALRELPDLIILDVMMPKVDGFVLCAELRRLGHTTPILMLTAKGQVEDRVKGLDLGADDFLTKPFSRDELLARIRAMLRRVQRKDHALRQFVLGDVRLDFVRFQAWRDGKPLPLSAKEFAMLKLMLDTPGEVISRERFLDTVWGYTAFPTTRTVDKHIVGLRQKLEPYPDHPRWIQTVHGVGYRFDPEGDVPSRSGDS